jgi:hypothetical protein
MAALSCGRVNYSAQAIDAAASSDTNDSDAGSSNLRLCDEANYQASITFSFTGPNAVAMNISRCSLKENLSVEVLAALRYRDACGTGAAIYDITAFNDQWKHNFVNALSQAIDDQTSFDISTEGTGATLLATDAAFFEHSANSCLCNDPDTALSGTSADNRLVDLSFFRWGGCVDNGVNDVFGAVSDIDTASTWPTYTFADVRARARVAYIDEDCAFCLATPLQIHGVDDIPYNGGNECDRGLVATAPNYILCTAPAPAP